MAKSIFFLIICVVATLFSIALALPGTAYYTNDQYPPSACSVPTPPGSLIARIAYLGGSITCGDSLRVTCVGNSPPCTDKSVIVKVVDHCSTCRDVTMVLSHEAISVIANPITVEEVININYQK
ncbi:putative EG45-like domain containing protein 1 [Solanum pennellii]|uniref:EG45-like domain containing protein 1 n=1 Tax=Solanum pennellii TaxID=28526 RepID=A0ABM1VE73_SOLPN|nr:putative EG45-like domain containing protein 1 [Solanum pennellii]